MANKKNKKHISILLSTMTVASFPAFAQTGQIAPNPNPVNSTITVNESGENSLDFSNHGVLSINTSGALSNSGKISNGIGDNTDNGHLGSLNNSGTLTNQAVGTLNTFGNLTNEASGALNNYGNLSNGTYNDHAGYLQNSGTLTNQASGNLNSFGNLTNEAGGALNNYGNLSNGASNDHAGYLQNSGNLTNQASGNLNSFGNLTNEAGGALNNYGNLSNGASNDHAGYLQNSGNLTNQSGAILNSFGNLTNEAGGSLNNSGVLNSGNLSDHAGYVGNSGTLTNLAGGLLTTFGYFDNSGILVNTGEITGTGIYTQTKGQTINNGSLSQASILINGGDLSGTGTISSPTVTIANGAKVNIGQSLGTLSINGDFYSRGNLLFKIAGQSEFDKFSINGNAFFTGGNMEFDFINDFKASAGDYWVFLLANTITIDKWNTPSVTFKGLGNGLGWNFTQIDGGERLSITTIEPVTEPETYTLLLVGLGLTGFMLRRRKTGNQH